MDVPDLRTPEADAAYRAWAASLTPAQVDRIQATVFPETAESLIGSATTGYGNRIAPDLPNPHEEA